MYSIAYRITTQAPVIISAISGDRNMVRTEQYISGTAVLGLIAKQIIKEKALGRSAHQDKDFYAWLLQGKIKISNAYILSQDEYGEYRHFPTPFSIEREKYGTAVYDGLFSKVDETKYLGGFCNLTGDSIQIQPVETQIEFHHARDREKGISKEGLIFNYESLVPQQIFEGEIRGEKSDLEQLLKYTGNQWIAFLGRSRNAQYGSVEFRFLKNEPTEITSDILTDDNNQLPTTISMTLLSDLILYNDFGFPTVDVRELEKELQSRLGDIQIEKAFVKKIEVENFVSVWRLKKPSETCFKAGSVFLLKINSTNFEALQAIKDHGIGERRHEGFGRVAFGWQTSPELTLMDEAKLAAVKPDFKLPQTVRKVLEFTIQNILLEGIKLQATEHQAEFVRLPSNSLISQLFTIANNSKGRREVFIEEINKLRKLAIDQMRRCVSRDYNLLEFLISRNPIDNFVQQPREINVNRLIKEIEYNLDDAYFKQKLAHAYYTSFFSMMRKRKIAEEKHNGRKK